MGVHKRIFSKIGYVFFALFWIMVSIILLFYAESILTIFRTATLISLECPTEGGTACFGVSAIYRMSFVLALFHMFLLIITSAKSEIAALFHDGCWTFKFMLVGAAFIGSLWIPNSFFMKYGEIARVISVAFLIF